MPVAWKPKQDNQTGNGTEPGDFRWIFRNFWRDIFQQRADSVRHAVGLKADSMVKERYSRRDFIPWPT